MKNWQGIPTTRLNYISAVATQGKSGHYKIFDGRRGGFSFATLIKRTCRDNFSPHFISSHFPTFAPKWNKLCTNSKNRIPDMLIINFFEKKVH